MHFFDVLLRHYERVAVAYRPDIEKRYDNFVFVDFDRGYLP